jgi:hypothetical protein
MIIKMDNIIVSNDIFVYAINYNYYKIMHGYNQLSYGDYKNNKKINTNVTDIPEDIYKNIEK